MEFLWWIMNYEDRIIVVDSYCGSGKTSWSIQHINELPEDTKIIYITPYLDEVERIIKSCPNKNFKQPLAKKAKGKKIVHLLRLINENENIASTHALFSNINDELINALKFNNYILILDEVFQTIEKFDIIGTTMSESIKDNITRQDVETLLTQGHIKIEDDYRITWIDLDRKLSKYNNLIEMSVRGLIYFVNGSLLLWSFPIEVFRPGIFDQIFILTYQFESQLQSYYYNYFDLEYSKYYVVKNENTYEIFAGKNEQGEHQWKDNIKNKIHILENNKLNKIGEIYYDIRNHPHESSLSKTWYDNNPDAFKNLSNNLVNYFINITKSKASERLWTCFKEYIPKVRSRYVTEGYHLSSNARATNDYQDRTVLAYMINRYLDPFYNDFFIRKNINIDQDAFGFSEMLQWIWRSAIRNGQDIQIYIPSYRMRNLLKKYLEN